MKPFFHALALCLFWASTATSQHFTTYSLDEGLPQSQVYALCEDRKGYLWLGTQGGGLCRFDGIRFEVFNNANGLISNFVSAVFEDDHGTVWVGTAAGLMFFDGKTFQGIPSIKLPVLSIAQAGNNALLVGTAHGVWRVDLRNNNANHQRLHPNLDQTAVMAIHIEPKGDAFFGSQRGLFFVKANADKAINIHIQLKLPPNPVQALAMQGGRLWVADVGAGLLCFEINPIRQVNAESASARQVQRVMSLCSDPKGQLWVGTQAQGLFQLDVHTGLIIKQFGEGEGLPHSHVRSLAFDHAGRLWVGTSGGGLARLGNQAFRRFDRSNGLPANRVYALCPDAQGRVWIAAGQSGLAVLDSAGFRAAAVDSGFLQGVKCRTLAFDAAGRLWAGTEGKGVMLHTTAGNRFFNKNEAWLPSDWVQKIVCDAQSGEVWIGTGEGLALLTPQPDGSFAKRHYGLRDGLPGTSITALMIDHQGVVWFGTLGGNVGFLQQKKVATVFDQKNGLQGAVVTGLDFDAAGRVWVATKGRGVWCMDSGKGSHFSQVKGLSSDNIYLIKADAAGRIWAGTENGVDCFSASTGAAPDDVRHYGKSEGFSGIETCQDAVLQDASGRLWFGTMNGLMQFLPEMQAPTYEAPSLNFEHITLYYKDLAETKYAENAAQLFDDSQGGLMLPWHQNHLSFKFKAIDLSRDEAMHYRWKLEGANADWSPWRSDDEVNFANLASGTYRLWVQAVGADLRTPSNPISAAFTIQKPFWKTWPFLIAAALMGAAVLGLGFRQYVQRVRRQEAAQREQLEIKNHILQLEQKALQLQMNPHFIFNALNSIQSLIATKDYSVARQEITQFAKLMRGVLNNSRKTAITLAEEMETLSQYLRVEQFSQQNAFTFDVKLLDETIDNEQVVLPPMLLQPFVENAVVHGVSHLNYPGHIAVEFGLEADFLLCIIRDNGVGREKAALLREAKRPGHQSAAVSVTQERLAALGGSFEIKDGESGGTVVTVRVRL